MAIVLVINPRSDADFVREADIDKTLGGRDNALTRSVEIPYGVRQAASSSAIDRPSR
jgi:hypothetical protein